MTVSSEEVEGMFEYWRTSLNAIIKPRSPVLRFVECYRRCLAATNVRSFNDSDIVFIGVLCQCRCTRLGVVSANLRPSLFHIEILTIPAAPAPTMTICFLLPCDRFCEDMGATSIKLKMKVPAFPRNGQQYLERKERKYIAEAEGRIA